MIENPDDKNGCTTPGKLASWYRRDAAITVWLVACCMATHHASAERFNFEKLTLTQHKARTLEIPHVSLPRPGQQAWNADDLDVPAFLRRQMD